MQVSVPFNGFNAEGSQTVGFEPWMGIADAPELGDNLVAVIVVKGQQAGSTDAFAIFTPNQDNRGHHPENMAIKAFFGPDAPRWVGNMLVLGWNQETKRYQSVKGNVRMALGMVAARR